MRQPVNNQELQFDESGTHVKYEIDSGEIFTLRLVLDFARHNLPQFLAKYQEITGLAYDPSAIRDGLEELSQLIRDARYLLLRPLAPELAVHQMTNPKVLEAVAELRADLEKKE